MRILLREADGSVVSTSRPLNLFSSNHREGGYNAT